MSGGRYEDNRKGSLVTRAHEPFLNSASGGSRRVCVEILGGPSGTREMQRVKSREIESVSHA
jgi:hypothetical protein